MRPSRLLPVALVVAALVPAVARGGDGNPAAPVAAPASPAAAFDAYAAGLPVPSVEQGIRFAGTLVMNGKQVGTCTFTAAPYAAAEGPPQWKLRDHVEFPSASGRRVEESVAYVTSALSLLRGSSVSAREGGLRRDWVRTDKGFRVTTTTQEGDVKTEAVRNVAHAGSATTTMTAAFLFGRLALDGAGEYATSIFDSGKAAQGKPPTEPVVYRVAGAGPWQGGKALLIRGKRGETDLLAAYHLRTRIFLGARLREGEGQVIEFLPGTKWNLPARNAKTCALRAALGFASGDAQLLDAVVHWPSIFEQAMGRRPEGSAPIDPEAFRRRVLGGWDEKLPRNERGLIEDVLNGFEAQLGVEALEAGRARVTFPEAFKGLVLDVADFEGTWYLVALPGMD